MLEIKPLHTVTKGDTYAFRDFELVDPKTGQPFDLTGMTVTLRAKRQHSPFTVVGPMSCATQGLATAGVTRADMTSLAAGEVDFYNAQLNFHDSNNLDQASPDFFLQVKERIA